MGKNAIQIKNLVKTYKASGKDLEKTALDNVSLDIPIGSIFGLLGPNGAGKSTLINILAGLVNKTSGCVEIWGFDQDISPRHSRASIGVMPQELNIDPFLSPRVALEIQAGLYGVPKSKQKTKEILDLIGLSSKADSYARSLSGGMRRRLLLGKALVHAPHILVLDEPTAGVDIELRQMLWNNIRQLNDQGMTIILTTHYLEEAEKMCDEIAILNKGQLIVQEKTQNLLGQIDKKTLIIQPGQDVALPKLPPHVQGVKRADGALVLTYQKSAISAGQILDSLRESLIPIADVASKEPDLEDVFLELTSTQP